MEKQNDIQPFIDDFILFLIDLREDPDISAETWEILEKVEKKVYELNDLLLSK